MLRLLFTEISRKRDDLSVDGLFANCSSFARHFAACVYANSRSSSTSKKFVVRSVTASDVNVKESGALFGRKLEMISDVE